MAVPPVRLYGRWLSSVSLFLVVIDPFADHPGLEEFVSQVVDFIENMVSKSVEWGLQTRRLTGSISFRRTSSLSEKVSKSVEVGVFRQAAV